MKRFVTRALIMVAAILGIVFAQVAPASAQPSDDLTSNPRDAVEEGDRDTD